MSIEKQPLVSIITGYYNRKENLSESINSILNQTYPNFEFIVFDDCSTDGTFDLLSQFAGHPKMKLVRHDVNIGLTKGLIKAIALAQGKYIAIHGAGDISYENRIAEQVKILEKDSNLGIVGCLMEDVYQGITEVVSPEPSALGSSFRFSHGEVMYRRDLYYQVGGYNSLFRTGQFTMLKFEMMKHTKAGYVDEVLYRRIHFKNGVTKNKDKRLEQLLNIQLGINISKHGLWDIDLSSLVIAFSFQNISLVKKGSEDEKRLRRHLKYKGIHYSLIYHIYRMGLIPSILIKKHGSLIRKIKHI